MGTKTPMIEEAPWPDFLANCGTFAMAAAAAAPHHRSFLDGRYGPGDLEAWLGPIRARFLDLLHYAPPPGDLASEVSSRQDHGDFVRETLYISTDPWSRVPCDVLLPKRPRDGRWPA